MRILYLKLINYIGIYNGMKLNEIEIDFTKCKNRIVLIKGTNGSGKSTLLKSLHPFPDANSNFVPSQSAYKEYRLLYDDIIYVCKCKHGMKSNGDREVAKAYITKITNNNTMELNPNGNITSYKEILETELGLDPNFLDLAKISSEKRGLVDKKPAERKKFIGSIMNNIENYNNMNKILTKRGSTFKSMVNALVTKIDNIGDPDKLKLNLVSIEKRLEDLNTRKEKLMQDVAANKSKVEILDPDSSIQNAYNDIYNNLVSLNSKYDDINTKISTSLSKLNIPPSNEDSLRLLLKDIKDSINKLEVSISISESRITTLLNDREEEAKRIQSKSGKLQSLQLDINYSELKNIILETKNNINTYLNIINKIGIKDIYKISKEEFIIGLNTLKEIQETINIFKSNMNRTAIISSVDYVKQGSYPDIDSINSAIENYKTQIDELKEKYQYYTMQKNIASKLSIRPCECKIDDCNFIVDAIKASKELPDKNLENISNQLKMITDNMNKLINNRELATEVIEGINLLKSILRNINKNISILNKLPIDNLYFDNNKILDAIVNGHTFSEIDTIYQYIDYANIIEQYKIEYDRLSKLETDYKLYESKNDIINEIMLEIDELNKKLNSISTEIEENNDSLLSNKAKLSRFKSVLLDLEFLLSLYGEKKNIENSKSELVSKFNGIKTNMEIIKECINNVNLFTSYINDINSQINPLKSDIDKMKHSLMTLDEYKYDLDIYSKKFNKVEVLKKHSSYNTGIQTLFMELYMNPTLNMANDLLKLIFDGEFVLSKYIINEDEFRIPCIGDGLPHDDISSMSTSQVCMISMIISFVILFQSSSRYNIPELDEIDAGLDTINRLNFITLLNKLMDIFNVEQSIVISHNNEINIDQCDIIQLKMHNQDMINAGNVIFKY